MAAADAAPEVRADRDIGLVSLIVTIAGILGALAIWRMARGTKANFLFERPAAFWIRAEKPSRIVAGGGVDRFRVPGAVRHF